MVWADHTERMYQEIEAESPKQAYEIARDQRHFWQPCFEHETNDLRVSNCVHDAETGEEFTVGAIERCRTCGNEIVATANDGQFHNGECSVCEEKRYRSQPALMAACRQLIAACKRGEDDGGAIEWSDLDAACDAAVDAVKKAESTHRSPPAA